MLAAVSNPQDPVAQELRLLRERFDELAEDNRRLRAELERSVAARQDLLAQAEHLIHMLDVSRKELGQLKGDSAS